MKGLKQKPYGWAKPGVAAAAERADGLAGVSTSRGEGKRKLGGF